MEWSTWLPPPQATIQNIMSKAKSKSLPVEQEAEDMAEEMPLHGAINEDEASLHIDMLDVIFDNMV